ncbi:hypothetical protein ABLV54_08660 [Klebsiella sp. JB_Kp042]|uniref:hypothetical protein n=1 Tax=Klebsiella sp. JB_Kp042 TaxID=3153394 RepID=UPI0032B3D8DE
MTKSTITREESVQAIFDLKVGYRLEFADIEILKRVARMALAAMDGEPVAYMTYKGYLLHAGDPKLAEYSEPMPLYADPRPEPISAEPVAWLLSGGGAKNVVVFDGGNAYADPLREVTPLYRHAQPAPVAYSDFEEFWSAYIHPLAQDDELKGFAWDIWSVLGSNSQPAPVVPGKWIPVSEQKPGCWCRTCRPVTLNDMRFVVCPDCGNKRCPRANDHRNACTGSNEPGQEGSAHPDTPREVK